MGAILNLPLTDKFPLQHRIAYGICKEDLNTKEIAGVQSNPRIDMYAGCTLLRATSDEVAWCASSMNYFFLAAAYMLNPGRTMQLVRDVSPKMVVTLEQRNFFATVRRTALDMGIDVPDADVVTDLKVVMPTFDAMARSFLLAGVKSAGEVGDVVIYSRGTDGVSGHVGFLEKQGPLMNDTMGGNESNAIVIKPYARASVLGYRKVG